MALTDKKAMQLIYSLDLGLAEDEIARIREVLKYAALSEIARMDASKNVKTIILDESSLGGIDLVGHTAGLIMRFDA